MTDWQLIFAIGLGYAAAVVLMLALLAVVEHFRNRRFFRDDAKRRQADKSRRMRHERRILVKLAAPGESWRSN